MSHQLRFAEIDRASLVDGEGIRYVIFTVGCIHNCQGCHNKEMQNYNYNPHFERDPQYFIDDIKKQKDFIDGITLSGGDPLYQLNAVTDLLKAIRADKDLKHINIWMYTGYKFEDIPRGLLLLLDVVIDGKYDENLPSAKFRGSSNQRVFAKNPLGGTNRWIQRFYEGEYEYTRYATPEPIRGYY